MADKTKSIYLSDIHVYNKTHPLEGTYFLSRFFFKFPVECNEGRNIDLLQESDSQTGKILKDEDGDFNTESTSAMHHHYFESANTEVELPKKCLTFSDYAAATSQEVITIEHMMQTTLNDVGYQVWPGSLLLCDYLLHHRRSLAQEIILDLGAGTGLTSIVAALCCQKIICTDYCREIMELAQRNWARNQDLLPFLTKLEDVKFKVLDWTDNDLSTENKTEKDEVKSHRDNKLFLSATLILAAEAVYDEDLTDACFSTIYHLLKKAPQKQVLMAVEKRFLLLPIICAQEVYLSKWFAFNRMAFLKNRDKPRSTMSTLAPDDDNESSGQVQEDHEDPELITETSSQIAAPDSEITTPTPVPTTPTPVTHVTTASSSSSGKPKPTKKRKIPEEDARIDEALGILKDAVSRSSQEDECGLFGQYVANKLRSYDPRTRAIVQHEINNSIFNADMKFHKQPLTASSTYTFTASRPQSSLDSSIGSSPSPQLLLVSNQHQYCEETQGLLESYWQQIVFSLASFKVCSPAYLHFQENLNDLSTIDDGNVRFTCQQISSHDLPQYFAYPRTKELELWKISSSFPSESPVMSAVT